MTTRNRKRATPPPKGARELRYPGWYTSCRGHIHGHFHRSCLERRRLAFVLEEYPDRVKRGRDPCPLCVPRKAPVAPAAARLAALGDGPKLAGHYRLGPGVIWGAFHEPCLRRGGGAFDVFPDPGADDQDDRPCPLCPSR